MTSCVHLMIVCADKIHAMGSLDIRGVAAAEINSVRCSSDVLPLPRETLGHLRYMHFEATEGLDDSHFLIYSSLLPPKQDISCRHNSLFDITRHTAKNSNSTFECLHGLYCIPNSLAHPHILLKHVRIENAHFAT